MDTHTPAGKVKYAAELIYSTYIIPEFRDQNKICFSCPYRNKDYFTVPGNLLRVQDNGRNSPNPKCFPTTFIEYTSDQWFTVESDLLADKVGSSLGYGGTFLTANSQNLPLNPMGKF